MAPLSPDVTAALHTLRVRWGWAAPRRLGDAVGPASDVEPAGPEPGEFGTVEGSLAVAPLRAPAETPPETRPAIPLPAADPRLGEIVPTGFAELDAILGPGGLPRTASVAIRGDGSSGRTTLALRLAAEAQAAGGIVAWLDLGRSFDPIEAVARGIQPEWLVVATPSDPDEGLAIAGALLASRSVDLLVVDLPGATGASRTLADRLGRLAALARRASTTLVLIEPPGGGRLSSAVAAAAGLRLELVRRAWIRLGQDVVGQRTEVTVARNRFGPPGRRAELRILYADGGERDGCLGHPGLLAGLEAVRPIELPTPEPETPEAPEPQTPEPQAPEPQTPETPEAPEAPALPVHAPATSISGSRTDATPPPLLAPPPSRPGSSPPLHLVAHGPDRPRRPAMDRRPGARRRPGGSRAGRQARDPARERPPAGARRDVPRPRAGG
jgi:recombination protein RecA